MEQSLFWNLVVTQASCPMSTRNKADRAWSWALTSI